MSINFDLPINESIQALELRLEKKIHQKHKNLFIAVILSAATYEEHKNKLNELYHLDKYLSLETYGDAILDLFVCTLMFKMSMTQKTMTIERSKLVNNARFQAVGKRILADILITSNYDEKDQITYAKALERLIGALYHCFGKRATERFIQKHSILTE